MDHISYLGIVVILVLTGCGLPLPEEAPVIAAGVASSGDNPTLNPWIALASCIIGALMGDSIIYAVGFHFGRNLVKDHPRLAHLLHAEREAKMEVMIREHGLKVLFLARFMVGIRGPVYLTAGILRMPYRRFLLMDAFCGSLVISLFFGLSYLFGPQIRWIVKDAELLVTVIVVLLVIGASAYLWNKRRQSTDASPSDVIDATATMPAGGEPLVDQPLGEARESAPNCAAEEQSSGTPAPLAKPAGKESPNGHHDKLGENGALQSQRGVKPQA